MPTLEANFRIFDVPISRLGFNEAISHCLDRASAGEGGAFYFANVHSVTESVSNPSLLLAMNQASACFADGMPLIWVSRWKNAPIGSRVCGPDFMRELIARTPNESHGFIGGLPGRSQELARRLGIAQAFHYSPPVRPYRLGNAAEDLKSFESLLQGRGHPKWIWVGLGAPKQELWIQEAARLRPDLLFFGVGAAFDFLSGTKYRAPVWMQRFGLEWLFRLLCEPRRLARRYFVTNAKFLWKILVEGF